MLVIEPSLSCSFIFCGGENIIEWCSIAFFMVWIQSCPGETHCQTGQKPYSWTESTECKKGLLILEKEDILYKFKEYIKIYFLDVKERNPQKIKTWNDHY